MASRVLVIGLDGASPDLLFERWRSELPALRSLIDRGLYGVLRSCHPPITVPAWAVMTSSRSPGALGVYGFRNRRDRAYDPLAFADSRSIPEPRVWDVLSTRGRDVIVLGVPPTYPVTPVNGAMVSCLCTPDGARWTHPPTLAGELESLVGGYPLDVDRFRADDKERLRDAIEAMTAKRFRIAEHLLETRPWDLFFMVETGTDRMHHAFWTRDDVLLDYYRALDEKIGRLLRFADDGTGVLVVSDHGAKRMAGAVAVNEWLRRDGYLSLVSEPAAPRDPVPRHVDWRRTVAWGHGGYYARIWLNVAGREPDGAIAPGEYESVRAELARKLEALVPGTRALVPDDLYDEQNGIAPDLLVYFGDLRFRSSGAVGIGAIDLPESDTGPDEANHAEEGIYVVAAPGIESGRGQERDLRDIAPTVLKLLGEPVPREMEGAAI